MTSAKINMKSGRGNNEKFYGTQARHVGTTTSGNPLLQILESPMEEVMETLSEELRVRYREAMKNKADVEVDILTTNTELKKLSEEVHGLLKEANRALRLLQDIALKPINASEVNYIDLLIMQVRSSGRKEHMQQIKELESFRKQAQLIDKLPSLDHLEATKSDSQSFFEQLR